MKGEAIARNVLMREVGGGIRGRGHMYTYGQFMLLYGKNHHNIVKQLSYN